MNYAIGDVQGNLDALLLLLKKIQFKQDRDKLFFLGDVVNRGKQSLASLNFLYSIKDNIKITLGNHDLQLLVCAYNDKKLHIKDTITDILNSNEKNKLVNFLIKQAIIIQQDNNILVHAGIAPQWHIKEALCYAKEIAVQLQGDNIADFLSNIYGNKPDYWSDKLTGYSRWRYIVNSTMRMRFCNANGVLEFLHKGDQKTQPKDYKAWFLHKNNYQNYNIIFGHWSSLNNKHYKPNNIYPLDTGCIWGGRLSAINLASKEIFSISC